MNKPRAKWPMPHPLAELFPMMPEGELRELADDMVSFGQRKKIVLLEGKVLDGRNRQAACRIAKLDPEYEDYQGGEPLYFVLSENLQRRHLTTSQRAMVAAKLVDWDKGLNQHSAGSANLPTQKAAEKLSISERAVTAARRISDFGTKDLVKAVRDGRISVHTGESISKLEHDAQREVLDQEEREIIARAKTIRTARMAVSRQRRIDKLAAISGRNEAVLAALPKAAFPIMLADVPWQNDAYSDETGQDRGYPYPPMPLEDIKALCAGDNSPALKHAGCFFWTTGNRIHLGVDVLRAWGFEPVASQIWDKVHIGTGRWLRDRHEILIIAMRGDGIPCPLPGDQDHSLFTEPKGDHSAKPDRVRAMIDRLWPDLAKLELFARGPADGWSVWGNEAGGRA